MKVCGGVEEHAEKLGAFRIKIKSTVPVSTWGDFTAVILKRSVASLAVFLKSGTTLMTMFPFILILLSLSVSTATANGKI